MYVRWRTWVCSGEGKRNKKHLERTDRKRHHKAETRTGCGAKFRVCRISKTMKNYIVIEFVSNHNHPLAAPHCVPFLRSHRRMGDVDIAQVMAMRNVGSCMKLAQIMDYMTCQSGGFHNVGFTVKDLRNKLYSIRKEEIRNGNAEGALGYLSAQVSNDPLFFFKYTVDEDDRLEALFWIDRRSKMDYAIFGDVLVFDTTYRTNAYKKPFVILAGVSNNFTTTIFGCALLSKETEDTYNWVLSMFLEAMDGKRPISVVTDGDLAMRNAIRNIFPDVRHRLCSWHLERNAAKNVHIPEFVFDFTILMQMECDVEEFETLWADMVSHYDLETNAWVVEMYSDRERWAEAYLLGHFFAGMSSTQHCEGMNHYLNRFLTVRLRLFEFVQQYHCGLARMRVADAEAETATEHSTPVLITQLKSLEKNGTEVYTQYIFRFFQDEIQRASALIVARRVDEMERRLYFIEMYSHPESNWMVEYYPIDSRINCSCLMFESFGLPCCHMIVVMKYEHLPTIPPSLVMRRWTRCGRPLTQQPNVCQISRSISHMARYGILSSGYKLMSFYASHAQDSFEDARCLLLIFLGLVDVDLSFYRLMIRRTGEILAYIRTLKMYAWELLFTSWLMETQFLEVKHLSAIIYIRRLSRFLSCPEHEPEKTGKSPVLSCAKDHFDMAIIIHNACCTWSSSDKQDLDLILDHMTVHLPKGSLVSVIGESFIGVLLKASKLVVTSSSYTLYSDVLQACALKVDIAQMIGGDLA
ncbi:protein FAR1-RELATED SEQUENCE 5-like [Rhododendron vialii]|uniref:protein FAR1-RELATED SEQUENCE 5-like n=1 Tax=Rhododendron vialii TaxID=182163 RepID=UPI00265DBD4F|nr:protein FAR1-RELATED SEQUENCE 5-like [Rhododendron vialii]